MDNCTMCKNEGCAPGACDVTISVAHLVLHEMRDKGVTIGVGERKIEDIVESYGEMYNLIYGAYVLKNENDLWDRLTFEKHHNSDYIWVIKNCNGVVQGFTYSDECQQFCDLAWSTVGEAKFACSLYIMLVL